MSISPITKQMALILSHPKYFCKYACFTQDQQDPENSCKPFPYHLEYAQRLVDQWYNEEKMIVLKSRQVFVSWLVLSCNVWLLLSGENRDIYIRRTKFEDAVKLLERMMFIMDNIPEKYKKFFPKYKDDKIYTYKEGQISIPGLNNKVYAMASGKDQGRGETPTSLVYDEFAFDEDDAASFSTMSPALQGKSRVTLISTPCPLFGDRDPKHRQLIEDRTGSGYEDEHAQRQKPYNELPHSVGLKQWVNKGNGFSCATVHYTADPSKRGEKWKARAMADMGTKDWNTEMELAWNNYAGAGVFSSEFNHNIHILKDRRDPDPRYSTLYRGWDFGGNHSVVVCQQVGAKLYVVDEFPNMGYNTRVIAKEVQQKCLDLYGDDFQYIEIIDPSGAWEGKSSTGLACKDVMLELGMTIIPGKQDPTRRIDAVMKLLTTNSQGTPNLLLNPSCHMLKNGFIGGYHYPEKATQNQKINRPVKNEFSHVMDSLEYVSTKMGSNFSDVSIPSNSGGIRFNV